MDRINELELVKKSFWRDSGKRDIWTFYCPVCKSQRKIPFHPRPGNRRQVLQIVLTGMFFTLVTWPVFDWKGIVSVFPIWMIFETFYRLRSRTALRCPYCAFDPFLYATDTSKARAEIEAHYRKVFEEKGIPYPDNNKKAKPRWMTDSPSKETPDPLDSKGS